MEQEQRNDDMTLKQVMETADELAVLNSKKIADKGAMVSDMPAVMASTVVLMIESASYAVGVDTDILYNIFEDYMKYFRERAERINKKLGAESESMKGFVGTEMAKKATDTLTFGKDEPQA